MENENTPQPLAEIPIGPSNFEQFLDRNQKSLIVFAILIVLLGAGVIVYKGLRDHAESNAGAALTLTYDEVARKYDIEGLKRVVADHAGTRAANTASYLVGVALWADGQQEEALKTLEKYIAQSTGDMQERAIMEAASFYHQMSNHEKALENYRTIIKSGSPVYAPLALINMGDIYKLAGDTDKAEQAYREAILQYPDSALSGKNENISPTAAERRLELLNVKEPESRMALPDLDTNILNKGQGTATPGALNPSILAPVGTPTEEGK